MFQPLKRVHPTHTNTSSNNIFWELCGQVVKAVDWDLRITVSSPGQIITLRPLGYLGKVLGQGISTASIHLGLSMGTCEVT